MNVWLNPLTRKLSVMLFVLINQIAFAQNIDPDFQIPNCKRSSEIYAIQQQGDGKILILGDLDFYNNDGVTRIVRLNADGSLDNSFQPALPDGFIPFRMKVMASGDILVHNSSQLVRLSTLGAVKNSLLLTGISSVVPLSDNRFFVGTRTGGLYRYRSNFKRDNSFPNLDNFANGAIRDVAPQGSGFVIAGPFSSVTGVVKNDLARIKSNGRVDKEFDTGTGTSDFIGSIFVQPDGKILLGNTYINSFNGTSGLRGLARLTANGSLDLSFTPLFNGNVINVFYRNSKVIVSTFNRVVQLNDDGSPDTSFAEITESIFTAPLVQPLSDGSLLIGQLKTLGGLYGIAKFDKLGNKNETFQVPLSRLGAITSMDEHQGSFLIGGDFFQVNNHFTRSVAKLNTNGTVNTDFKVEVNNADVFKLKVLADGSVLSSAFNGFVKLSPNGSVDDSFNFSPFDKLYQVNNFYVQSDNKIIAGGPNNIYRLNADGSEDPTFNIGSGICCWASTAFGLDLQADEKVLYGSMFNEFNGTPVNRLIRLNADGSLDQNFAIGTGPNETVYYVKELVNKEILVAGFFDQFNGNPVPYSLVKVSSSGSLDHTFLSNFSLPSSDVYFSAVGEWYDRILLGGFGTEGAFVSAISNDGTPDPLFSLPSELKLESISDMFVSSDHSIFVLGPNTISGLAKYAMVKLNALPPAALTTAAQSNTALFFPNPAKDNIQFNDVKENATVKIVDFAGGVRIEAQISKDKNSIDVSGLPDGIYVLGIQTKETYTTSYLVKKN